MSSTGTPARPPQDLTTCSDDHDEHDDYMYNDDVPDTPESSLTAVLERIKARSEAAGRTVAIDLPPGSSSAEAEPQTPAAPPAASAGGAPGGSYDVDSARRLLVQAQRRTDRILTDQQQRRMLTGGTAAGHDAAVSDDIQQLQQARQSSSGIVASAGNWLFGSKIERRRKEELRAQVEQQRRVLRRAIRRNRAAKSGGNQKRDHHPHHTHQQQHRHDSDHGATGGIFGRGICSALAAAYSYEDSDDDINDNDGDNDGAASTTSSQCSKCSSATSASRRGGEDDNDDVVEHPIDTGSGYHVNVHVPSPNKGDKDDNRDANDDANNVDNGNSNVDADADDLTMEVIVEAEPNTTKHILTAAQRRSVALHVLPPSVRYCRWRRLYSLARDGDSFEAFLRHVAGWKRTLLVLSTSRGDVFGAYADSAWENQGHSLGATFYGSAQASLWRIQSNDGGGDGDSPRNKVIVYKWTGANRYIQLCDPQAKLLALGGGGDDGEFGLCVENDFQRGSTGSCETFGNEPLCGQDRFDIVDLECYGFPTGFA